MRSAAAAVFVMTLAQPALAATEPVKGQPSRGEPAKAEPAKAPSTKAETAKADENRKKPLQRCDQLADKAQHECLQKARQRVVEARQQREAAGEKRPASADKGVESAKGAGAKDAAPQPR
jgi:hypothetical protein